LRWRAVRRRAARFDLTVLIALLPFIVLLAMGRRAESTLPKIRDWMNASSWIVNEAVLVFFLAMALF
jgi:hypothetical protein